MATFGFGELGKRDDCGMVLWGDEDLAVTGNGPQGFPQAKVLGR